MLEQFVLHDCGRHGTLEVRHGDSCPCCYREVLIQNESAVVVRSVMTIARAKRMYGYRPKLVALWEQVEVTKN